MIKKVVYFEAIIFFQVLKLRIELVSHLAQNAEFTKVSAEYCLPDLVDKVGDVKNGTHVQEAFSCMAEATSLDFVAGEVCDVVRLVLFTIIQTVTLVFQKKRSIYLYIKEQHSVFVFLRVVSLITRKTWIVFLCL